MFQKKIPLHLELLDHVLGELDKINDPVSKYLVYKKVVEKLKDMNDAYYYKVPAIIRKEWHEETIKRMPALTKEYVCVICGEPCTDNLIVCNKCEKNNI